MCCNEKMDYYSDLGKDCFYHGECQIPRVAKPPVQQCITKPVPQVKCVVNRDQPDIPRFKGPQVNDFHRDKCVMEWANKLSDDVKGVTYLMSRRNNELQDAVAQKDTAKIQFLSNYSVHDAKRDIDRMQSKVDIDFLNKLCSAKQDAVSETSVWDHLYKF